MQVHVKKQSFPLRVRPSISHQHKIRHTFDELFSLITGRNTKSAPLQHTWLNEERRSIETTKQSIERDVPRSLSYLCPIELPCHMIRSFPSRRRSEILVQRNATDKIMYHEALFKKKWGRGDTLEVSDRRKSEADRWILAFATRGTTFSRTAMTKITGGGETSRKESISRAIGRHARQVERVNADVRPSLWRAASHWLSPPIPRLSLFHSHPLYTTTYTYIPTTWTSHPSFLNAPFPQRPPAQTPQTCLSLFARRIRGHCFGRSPG